MRTKYMDKKKEIENAFSFGHVKKENTNDSTKKKTKKNQWNEQNKRHDETKLNQKSYTQNITYPKERTPLQNRNSNERDQQLFLNYQNFDNEFGFGKPIKSETIEESIDTIIQPLQQQMKMIKQQQQKLFHKNNDVIDRFYNPSIEKIKQKYGYHGYHETKQQPQNIERQFKLFTKSKPTLTTQIKDFKKIQSNYNNPYEKVYGYQNKSCSKIPNYQKRQQRILNLRNDSYMNRPTTTSSHYNQTDPKTYRQFDNCQQQDIFIERLKQIRQRTKTLKKRTTQNRPSSKSFAFPKSPTQLSKQTNSNNDWVLKSISDLDSKINQKLNKIMPSSVHKSVSKWY